MQILTWLSLAYAVILVVALAVSLILILVHLLRVRAALRPVAAALEEVAGRTAPLEPVMHQVSDAVASIHRHVKSAAEEIVHAGALAGVRPPEPPPVQAGAVARWQEVP